MQEGSRGTKKIMKKIISFKTLIEIIFWALLAGGPPGGAMDQAPAATRCVLIGHTTVSLLSLIVPAIGQWPHHGEVGRGG